MRKLTKSMFGVVSLGVIAASYSFGLANQTQGVLTGPVETPATPLPAFTPPDDDDEFEDEDDDEGEGLTPTPSASLSPTATATPSSSSTPAKTATPSKTTTPTKTATPTKVPTATPTKTATPAPTNATPGLGDPIFYRYGTIQLQVAKSGGALSEVKIIVANVRGNEFAAVPNELAQAAIAANGTKFANVSGATFTSNAFRQALDSALGKL